MKRLAWPAALLSVLVLFAFTAQPGNGVTRLGRSLYRVQSTAPITPAHKQELTNIVSQVYRLSDLSKAQETTLQGISLETAKGKNPNAFIDRTIARKAIDEKVVRWDNSPKPEDPKEPEPKDPQTAASIAKMNSILTTYADKK